MFVVDGGPTVGNTDVSGAINALERAVDVTLISVGLSSLVTRTDLMALSSNPRQQDVNWFQAQAYWRLSDIQDNVVRALRSVQPSTPGPSK